MAVSSSTSVRGQSGAIRGILLLLFSFFILAIQDVILKLLSSDYALLQIVLIRTLIALPLVYWQVHRTGGLPTLRTKQLGLQIMRGTTMFTAYFFFFLAISAIPYSLHTALFFSSPLFITALGVPFLNEQVGWRRWVAVGVGFVGVMITLDLRGVNFDPATLLSVASALMYALSIICTRKLNDTPQAITAYTAGAYLTGGVILAPIFVGMDAAVAHPSVEFLTKVWPTPTMQAIGLIGLTAVFWTIGLLALSAAYRDTSVAILAPFEYFSVGYGFLFGYLFWQEVPTPSMLIGLVLIVGSGLFIIYRENRAPT